MKREYKFSLFEKLNSKKNTLITIDSYVDSIKLGFWKNKVEPARKEYQLNGKSSLYNELKRKLNNTTPSVIINQNVIRSNEEIQEFSGLIIIDIDNDKYNAGKLTDDLINRIKADKYTFVLHKSVSGVGFCVFIKVDLKEKNKETEKKFYNIFRSLQQYYKSTFDITIDKQCSDLSRARFTSYDKDIYYNKTSEVYVNELIEPVIINDYKPVKAITPITYNTPLNSDYRVKLEPYIKGSNNKKICPSCKGKKLMLYMDYHTGNYIANNVGRCDSKKCGYHYTYREYKADNPSFKLSNDLNAERLAEIQKELSKPKGFHSIDLVKQARSNNSNFMQFLHSKFDKNKVDEVAELYQIGCSNHFGGNSIVFWHIDCFNSVHYGNVMQYDKVTGKRLKTPFNHITSVHNLLKDETAKYSQHLFGEHLINLHPNKTILIVESEKTALIGAIVLPQYNWIACCGVGKLNADKLKNIIHYREQNKIKLVPDLDALDVWNEKGNLLGIPMLKNFSDNATEEDIKGGADLADLILRDVT